MRYLSTVSIICTLGCSSPSLHEAGARWSDFSKDQGIATYAPGKLIQAKKLIIQAQGQSGKAKLKSVSSAWELLSQAKKQAQHYSQEAKKLGFQNRLERKNAQDEREKAYQDVMRKATGPHAEPFVGSVGSISPKQLVARQKAGENVLLLDLRASHLYGQEHIPNAVPAQVASLRHRNFPNSVDLIIYGENDEAVELAIGLRHLTQRYEKVFKLEGGLEGWKKAGLPLGGTGLVKEQKRFVTKSVKSADLALERTPKPLLIDLRSEDLYSAGHLPNAHHVALETILELGKKTMSPRTKTLLDSGAPIVVYAASNQQAQKAGDSLLKHGMRQVRWLEGGPREWVNQGYRLSTKQVTFVGGVQ